MNSVFNSIFNYIFTFCISVKNEFLGKYIYDFSAFKALELTVFCLGFVFIHLMIKENRYAWLVAAFNCSVLIFILLREGVIGQVALYIFYVVNSLYAFYSWSKKDSNNKAIVQIKRLKWYVHLIQVVLLSMLVVSSILVIKFCKQKYGLVSNQTGKDMFILIFSIYALILQVKKNIENWLYFTIVDFTIFITYLELNLLLLAIVRGYITIMSGYGLCKWMYKYYKKKKLELSCIDS